MELTLGRIGRNTARLLRDSCFVITQSAAYPPNFVISKSMGINVHRPRGLRLPQGTLILANHQSRLDPFLVTYHLGRRNWPLAIPVRFPVTPVYMRKRFLSHIIRALGGYNMGATPLESAKKLLFTRALLDKKRTVLLFPQGKIAREGQLVDEFKQGAKMLFANDYPVVFARLIGFNEVSPWTPLANRGKQVHIYYSDVITGDVETKTARMASFFSGERPS